MNTRHTHTRPLLLPLGKTRASRHSLPLPPPLLLRPCPYLRPLPRTRPKAVQDPRIHPPLVGVNMSLHRLFHSMAFILRQVDRAAAIPQKAMSQRVGSASTNVNTAQSGSTGLVLYEYVQFSLIYSIG